MDERQKNWFRSKWPIWFTACRERRVWGNDAVKIESIDPKLAEHLLAVELALRNLYMYLDSKLEGN